MVPFHAIRFYDSTESMASIVAAFLGTGWVIEEPALVIASPVRHSAIARAIRSMNFSMDSLCCSGKLCVLDANDTLRQVMLHGVPDPVRFESIARSALDGLAGAGAHTVRVYDEMADVLWKRGEPQAALRLDGLWDDLAARRTCSIVCSHGVADAKRDAGPRSLCSQHSHVLAPNGLPHPVSRR